MRRGRGQNGQATVEVALILPLLVLFAFLVAQAGLVAKDLLLVHHAAREAARAAAVDPTPSTALAAASSAGRLDASRLSVSLSGGVERGSTTTAVVHYRSPTNLPLIGRLVGDIDLEAAVTMRVE